MVEGVAMLKQISIRILKRPKITKEFIDSYDVLSATSFAHTERWRKVLLRNACWAQGLLWTAVQYQQVSGRSRKGLKTWSPSRSKLPGNRAFPECDDEFLEILCTNLVQVKSQGRELCL